jgi:hypothetical protein
MSIKYQMGMFSGNESKEKDKNIPAELFEAVRLAPVAAPASSPGNGGNEETA